MQDAHAHSRICRRMRFLPQEIRDLRNLSDVEELAFLIKDNLHCKHLVLSTEEALISFLQNDSR
ncbi:hypothetical protein MA16_Dca022498 [Dendrobium catenatum]|uniref:Uncharacterized protein n=1 Tax=Dendrobium catenatum TaxID=906689 RepID=A0A2I0XG00_9ASPA|nr:hypothetical protein MA16_Dca022498 [Dendrobium catenatum]